MPGFDPQILKQGQQATAKALKDRAALAAAVATQTAQIAALEAQIGTLNQAGDQQSADALRTQAAQLRADRTRQQSLYQEIDKAWAAAIGDFMQNLDPC